MPPTALLFRDDAYLQEASAIVLEVDDRGIVVDRTPFYATGGGQPGDAGELVTASGRVVAVTTTVYDQADKSRVIHALAAGSEPPTVGEAVSLRLDWARRHKLMRVHTALHLLSVVLPFPVTGGAIGEGEGRLDFDIPDPRFDKDELTAKLMEFVARDAAVTERWITDEELDANPGLVKTMSVKPPRGAGRVRLVSIEGIDLQPCGGTHVRSTAEIGQVAVTAIENKGKQNRRVRIALQ